MKVIKHVITLPQGIHARPAGMLVKAASAYESQITVTTQNGSADAKRLIALMCLTAKPGMEMTLTIAGSDEEKAAQELQAFLVTNF